MTAMPLTEGAAVKMSGDRAVVLTRTFNAPRRLVFDAHTRPELVRRWLLGPPGWTMPVCEIDLRVGGRIRYVWRGPDGSGMGMSGTYREIVPPRRLVHTEIFDEDWSGGEMLVTTEFAEKADATSRHHDDPLHIAGRARCRARHGHDRGHEPELRPSRGAACGPADRVTVRTSRTLRRS